MAGADLLLQSWRGAPRRERRRVPQQGPAGVVNGRLEQRSWETETARSGPRSRSSPTRSARACAGPRPRSRRPRGPPATAASAVRPGGAPAAGGARLRWPADPTALRRRRAVLIRKTRPNRTKGNQLMASKKNRRPRLPRSRPPQVQEEDQCAASSRRSSTSTTRTSTCSSRFMSDRAKIRNRRVSGNDRQQQLESPTRSRSPARWRCCRTPSGSLGQRTRPPRDGRSRPATTPGLRPVDGAGCRRRREHRGRGRARWRESMTMPSSTRSSTTSEEV